MVSGLFFFLVGKKISAHTQPRRSIQCGSAAVGGGRPTSAAIGGGPCQPSEILFGHASEGQSSAATSIASGCAAPCLAMPFRPLWLR